LRDDARVLGVDGNHTTAENEVMLIGRAKQPRRSLPRESFVGESDRIANGSTQNAANDSIFSHVASKSSGQRTLPFTQPPE
jgi:hypothetical protein